MPPLQNQASKKSREVSEEELVDGLRGRRAWAERVLLERYTVRVQTVLARIMGGRANLDDMTQEVFVRVLDRIPALRDADALGPWLTQFAVNVAREQLKADKRRRWLLYFSPESVPDLVSASSGLDDNVDVTRAINAVYEVLDGMSADHRIAFSLRHIETMDLPRVATACNVSLATISRRLRRAEASFRTRARNHPVLREWLGETESWR